MPLVRIAAGASPYLGGARLVCQGQQAPASLTEGVRDTTTMAPDAERRQAKKKATYTGGLCKANGQVYSEIAEHGAIRADESRLRKFKCSQVILPCF